jgi:hypothetical protein
MAENYFLIPLVVFAWVVFVDRNVPDYLYYRFIATPWVQLQSWIFKIILLFQLKRELFFMRRGHVPKKYIRMAKEILPKPDPTE